MKTSIYIGDRTKNPKIAPTGGPVNSNKKSCVYPRFFEGLIGNRIVRENILPSGGPGNSIKEYSPHFGPKQEI